MADILELERRVAALEAAQNDTTQTLRWVVTKLAQMSALQNEHTLRLESIDGRLDRMENRLDKIDGRLDRSERESANWRRDLPAMMAETMREVLREQKGGEA
jgi:chromosome segregation ATPase